MIPRAVRHIVIAPLFCVVVIVVVVVSPILILGAALLSTFIDRRLRPVRAVTFVLIYAIYDVIAVLAGFALWLRLAGRGAMNDEPMQSRHYRLMSWFLGRVCGAARELLGVRVVVEHSEKAEALLGACTTPVIVLSRHAGPGDSFLLVQELLVRGRRPRIVLRAALQLDPGIDLLGNRLPFCFVSRTAGSSDATCERIAEIAATMDSRGALLLFPEGGNFTPQRRRNAIRSLLRSGNRRHARSAANMEHVVAPRPGGVLSALNAAPGADVIFVAHSGLAGMDARLWRRVPVERELQVEMFVASAASIPVDDTARIEWLYVWWKQLDNWVSEHTH